MVAPLTVKDFLEQYWERCPLLTNRQAPDFYAALPKEGDVEFFLSSLTAPQAGWFSLVKEQARPPSDSFLTGEGMLNLAAVYSAFREGYSLLLNQVQKRHRATGGLCRNLEIAFSEIGITLSRHIGANLYLSPSRSRGFSIHYDPHDVFILQLQGRKHWRLYGSHIAFPLNPPNSPVSRKEAGSIEREFVLQPGDFVYIPRGYLHEAYTEADRSLHLTLSLEVLTWLDLFSEILANDPRFRRGLPVGFFHSGSVGRRARELLAKQANALSKSPAIGEAITHVAARLLANLDLMPNGGLARIKETASLTGDTWVGLADGVFGHVSLTRDAARLHLPGASFTAHRHMAPTFRYLFKQRVFRVRDLPVTASTREKVKFIQALARSGYIVRLSGRPTRPLRENERRDLALGD
jgi:hypothetical protein